MDCKDDLIKTSIFQSASKEITSVSSGEVKGMLDHISGIINQLNDSNFRMIIEIKASARFTERLSKTIKHHTELANRMDALSTEFIGKLQDTEESIRKVQEQRESKIKEAKDIKSHLESELSKIYKRTINIMGEINTILN